MSNTLEDRRSGEGVDITVWSWEQHTNAYECRVAICPEEGGGFSIFCLNLPGVASQGENEDEAIENIKEAFRGAMLAYQQRNESIPWASAEEIKAQAEELKGTKQRWIVVDV